ncbi:MAG: hypothetical protein HRT35_21990 [Algicola sp.]|nr:hypothetical protein [Algicola sp.]
MPSWVNTVAALAIVWNLLGVVAFGGGLFITPEMLAELPQAEQDLHNATPGWAIGAFAVAVFGGLLGCITLLIKKAVALPILIISGVGILVQMFHAFFIVNSFAVFGPGGTIMPIMVIVIAIALIGLATKAKTQAWIT